MAEPISERTLDYMLDRRLLRRKLTVWRAIAFGALILAVVVAGWRGFKAFQGPERQIARIAIEGLIVGDKATLKLIDDVTKAKNAEAVILTIQSPGGTTTGSDALYQALRRLGAQKPTVAVVDGMAASGAYIAALGADHIVAAGNSLVGSIGVLFQFPNVAKLLDTVGVKVETVKSSPLKAAPNGFEPTSPEARAALAALVSDSYTWFKDLVKDRRHMSDAELAVVSDGRVFTGRQSLPLKLVDELGDERTALAWLKSAKGIPAGLPVHDWKPKSEGTHFNLFSSAAQLARLLGQADLASLAESAEHAHGDARLDGLLALWQPQSAN